MKNIETTCPIPYPSDPIFNATLHAGFAKERGGQISPANVLCLAEYAEQSIRLLQSLLAGKAVC